MDTLFGVINLDKPTGITSRAAINRLQRQVRPAKLGHAGTLDPLASGVLLLLVGKATRLMPYVQRLEKKYLATFQLGVESETEDIDGTVTTVEGALEPTREQVLAELPRWTGRIMQKPPSFSALKYKGQRAYHLARQGQLVELSPREVMIHQIELDDYQFPFLRLQICCGSGTYIRSLGRDIAQALGSSAVMSQLVRTSIGEFAVETACTLEDLQQQGVAEHLLPARRLVNDLPAVTVDSEQRVFLANGRAIDFPQEQTAEEIVLVDGEGKLLGIAAAAGPGKIRPVKSFGL
ncbi:MAG: tRNA pseudouridine(55) synthase TruB [Planctomycetota bacterium]|nr:tRNA pseudouridine(55) synthase TruB [Planctomycetota bacterium]